MYRHIFTRYIYTLICSVLLQMYVLSGTPLPPRDTAQKQCYLKSAKGFDDFVKHIHKKSLLTLGEVLFSCRSCHCSFLNPAELME